uniref:scavenger receptor cysteine-rich domain-containing group B protein isoform 3 n=1 Tax=Rattus norvegicus TaxID=10116 RepID=UPI00346253E7
MGPEELGLQVQQDGSETTRMPSPRPRDGEASDLMRSCRHRGTCSLPHSQFSVLGSLHELEKSVSLPSRRLRGTLSI